MELFKIISITRSAGVAFWAALLFGVGIYAGAARTTSTPSPVSGMELAAEVSLATSSAEEVVSDPKASDAFQKEATTFIARGETLSQTAKKKATPPIAPLSSDTNIKKITSPSPPIHASSISLPPSSAPRVAPQNSPSVSSTSRECSFAEASIPSHEGALINEVAWMGGAGSASDEWIELKNLASAPLSLNGWQLLDKEEQINITFTASDVISAQGYFLLERTNDQSVADVPADALYTGGLGNTNEGLRLFDSQCVLRDEVLANPSWPAGAAGTRKTMERDDAGFGWHTAHDSGGTPKALNSPPPPPERTLSIILGGDGEGRVRSNPLGIDCGEDCDEAYPSETAITLTATPTAGNEFNRWEGGGCAGSDACAITLSADQTVSAVFRILSGGSGGSGGNPSPSPSPSPSPEPGNPPPAQNEHVLISEVQVRGISTTDDFIELYNPLSTPFNLKGHRLVKRTAQGTTDISFKSWTDDAFVPAHGFYLWANSNAGVAADVTTVGTIADNNSIALRFGLENTGTIVDAVTWGEVANGLGEGAHLAGGLTANQSYERKALENGICVSPQVAGEPLGNGCDTGDNGSNFEIRAVAGPQNSQAPAEP